MNSKNENRLNMYLVVSDYIHQTPPATLLLMPGFDQLYTDFILALQTIQAKSQLQSSSRLGYRMVKTAGKEEAVIYAINMASCITAYALSVNNTVLVAQMKFTKSALVRKRDTATLDDLNYILSRAIELHTKLTDYGIKQPQIDQLTATIQSFAENIPIPRTNIVSKKILTKEIKELFTQGDVLLKRMDKLVNILSLNDEKFCTSYFFSRRIVNNAGRKLSLRGKVTNVEGNFIGSVLVAIPAINRKTKTTALGYFSFKNLPAGTQLIIFSRVDYKTAQKEVGLISGERIELNVILKKDEDDAA